MSKAGAKLSDSITEALPPAAQNVTAFGVLKVLKSLSRVRLRVTPWTVGGQAPLSMGFSRREYWSGWPFPSPGDLCNPGIEPSFPALQADCLPSEPLQTPTRKVFGELALKEVIKLKGAPQGGPQSSVTSRSRSC